MATVTTPDDLARRMEQFRQDRIKALKAEVGRVAAASQGEAVRLTSGPQRTGRERGPVSPLPIGVRSGALRGGWRLEPFTRGEESGWRLFNVAPHHVYVLSPGGTARMRSRGFWTALRRFSLAEFEKAGVRVSVRTPT